MQRLLRATYPAALVARDANGVNRSFVLTKVVLVHQHVDGSVVHPVALLARGRDAFLVKLVRSVVPACESTICEAGLGEPKRMPRIVIMHAGAHQDKVARTSVDIVRRDAQHFGLHKDFFIIARKTSRSE
jgi:hypothetical protein